MIPNCRENGCFVARTPGRPACSTHQCALDESEPETPPRVKPAPKRTQPKAPIVDSPKPKPVDRPKPKPVEGRRTHYSTGKQVTSSTLPGWRPWPEGPEPWERALCGNILTSKHFTSDKSKVNCGVCSRILSK